MNNPQTCHLCGHFGAPTVEVHRACLGGRIYATRAELLYAAHFVEMALLERFDDEDTVWAAWATVLAAVDNRVTDHLRDDE